MALVRKYPCRVVACQRILSDVYTLTLATLDRPFRYCSGQFLHLALDPYDPSAPWPDSRCFSIQSPPGRSARELSLSFSVKGSFTRRMADELLPGKEIWLKLPYGDLLQSSSSKAAQVFLAGGTGVTPFLSLFLDPSFASYSNVSLYLGIRSADYHVFSKELAEAQSHNPRFEVAVFPEDTRGRIDLEEVVGKRGLASSYFLSGPPAMIHAFAERLVALGVPAAQIRRDDWE